MFVTTEEDVKEDEDAKEQDEDHDEDEEDDEDDEEAEEDKDDGSTHSIVVADLLNEAPGEQEALNREKSKDETRRTRGRQRQMRRRPIRGEEEA